jgi:hypothetical protein
MSYCACHDEEIRGGRVFEISADQPERIETKMVRVKDVLASEET